jgi:hypothetical protein
MVSGRRLIARDLAGVMRRVSPVALSDTSFGAPPGTVAIAEARVVGSMALEKVIEIRSTVQPVV